MKCQKWVWFCLLYSRNGGYPIWAVLLYLVIIYWQFDSLIELAVSKFILCSSGMNGYCVCAICVNGGCLLMRVLIFFVKQANYY
jgi:hypothetical protein